MTDPKPDETPVVLECGCTLTFDTDKDSGTLAWLVPCSRVHRLVAQLSRKPGSMVVVCEVPS